MRFVAQPGEGNLVRRLYTIAALIGVSGAEFAQNILVYNNNTVHNYGQTAASNVGTVTVGNSATFNGLLTGGSWDVVVVDCPSTEDAANWAGLETYVNSGGRAIMSFWNWGTRSTLRSAFGAAAGTNHSWNAQTLFSHDAAMFAGVSNPNSDWHDHWFTDGQVFTGFVGTSLGGLSAGGDTVMFLGNAGRTIAMSVIDEAGDTWNNNGSAVQLWENGIRRVLVPEPATTLALLAGLGGLALRKRRIQK
jgi:hypothetical protein